MRPPHGGDWIVVGARRDQLDYGKVYEGDDGKLWVAWFGDDENRRTLLDSEGPRIEVFESRGGALGAYRERLDMYPSTEE